MSIILRYGILRYYPWSERDEFINIGVILESPYGVVYRLLKPLNYRFTTILERDELEELGEVIEFSMFRTREFATTRVQRDSKTPRRLPAPLEKYVGQLPSELQCSDLRTIFLERDDAHLVSEYLNRLFERQVERRMRAPKRKYVERGRLIRPRLKSDLANWRVLEKLLPAQDLVVTVGWPMDFLYRLNGTEGGIRVLDCRVKRISEDIRIVYGASRDIQESQRTNVSVIAVIGNHDANPTAYDLASQVLATQEVALKLIEYDTEHGRERLRQILQTEEISRSFLVP